MMKAGGAEPQPRGVVPVCCRKLFALHGRCAPSFHALARAGRV